MHDPKAEGRRWLGQAENDLAFARHALDGAFFHHHAALESLRDLAAELDLYYVPTRYPNGLVEGMPYEVFTRTQAERALTAAETILAARP